VTRGTSRPGTEYQERSSKLGPERCPTFLLDMFGQNGAEGTPEHARKIANQGCPA